MLLNSVLETKPCYSKEEALIRMIALEVTMKRENGSQYYCYRDGVFYVSSSADFLVNREWNTNDSSPAFAWANI